VLINFKGGEEKRKEDLRMKFSNMKRRWKDYGTSMTLRVWFGSRRHISNMPKFLFKKRLFGNKEQRCIG
jgi:hypothetical protein